MITKEDEDGINMFCPLCRKYFYLKRTPTIFELDEPKFLGIVPDVEN